MKKIYNFMMLILMASYLLAGCQSTEQEDVEDLILYAFKGSN